MEKIGRPTKEQVRDWLKNRHTTGSPLPEQEQIKRELWQAEHHRCQNSCCASLASTVTGKSNGR